MKRLRKFKVALLTVAMAGVACVAHSASEENATVQEKQTTTGQMTAGAQFLKTLHQLVLNPPMTPEKITAAFGWPVLEKKEDATGRHFSFDLYPNQTWANPKLGERKSDGKTHIFIQLMRNTLCISSEEVLSEFGNKFKPTMANIEGAPAYSTLSEAVKRNLKLFFSGPRYHIESPVKVVIGFDFPYSECLSIIDVYHPTY